MELVKVISTVTPSDTFFVIQSDKNSDFYCKGVLMFWLVADMRDDKDGETFTDMLPICSTGWNTLTQQIDDLCAEEWFVHHWSEMRLQLPHLKYYDEQESALKDHLALLWKENE